MSLHDNQITRHENIACVIAVPRQSSSRRDRRNGHPDCRCVPIQIVALQQQQERFDAFIREFNTERPHEALDMKCPAEFCTTSARPYDGLPELIYPFHDRELLVTACGRLCLHRKRINISIVLAGQKLGIKEVDDGVWLVSFMHYDLGYFDLEQKTLQPLDNPFGTRLSPMS